MSASTKKQEDSQTQTIIDLSFIAEKCRGCLRCELACSFHHSGWSLYQPAISSTHIRRDNENKRITMFMDSSCDFCMNEKFPLCVKACPFGARGVIYAKQA